MLLLMMLGFGLLVVAGRVGPVLDDAARARTAADAAALAGAVDGRVAARALAEANGGELVAFVPEPNGVTVVVRVGRVSARARATASGEWVPG